MYGKVNQPFPGNICLSDLTSLRTLNLHISVPGYSVFQGVPCDLLPPLSSQARAPTTIETICFDLYFANVLNLIDLQHPENAVAGRQGIDSVLTTRGLYPYLKTVKVRYLFRSQDFARWFVTQPPEALAKFQDAVTRVFPQVSASESIKLEITSEPFNQYDDEYDFQWYGTSMSSRCGLHT